MWLEGRSCLMPNDDRKPLAGQTLIASFIAVGLGASSVSDT